MITDEQIDALKAQVNCLRGYLKEISEYWNGDTNEIVMKDACYQALNVSQEALERIPKQCLAEVKAKAIMDMQRYLNTYGAVINDGNDEDWYEVIKHSDVVQYVEKLMEQAK